HYQEIAKVLGLPSETPEEGVASLAQAVYDLGKKIGVKMSFKEQGLDKDEYMSKISEIAYLAYEDQCTPCNPRLALVSDMEEILADAYYGMKNNPEELNKLIIKFNSYSPFILNQ